MYPFRLPTEICSYNTFADYIAKEPLKPTDLLLMSKFLYKSLIQKMEIPCKILFRGDYGSGEPSDAMIDAIRADIPKDTTRVIAIGGGAVIDIAKIVILDTDAPTEDIVTGKVVPTAKCPLIAVPTTCGTGSEVTNLSIVELINLRTKKGIGLDCMFPKKAILISEFINDLPYETFATSSIDALVHASESFVSPKATAFSRLFSIKAIEDILEGYMYIIKNGKESFKDKADKFLIASTFAGIAFSNAGCAAVHAISYPLGGVHHVAHGEANKNIFMPVFRKYKQKQPVGSINEFEDLVAKVLSCTREEALTKLDEVTEFVVKSKPLSSYGMTEEEIAEFSQTVITGQQRLLANNYVELTYDEVVEIYKSCF